MFITSIGQDGIFLCRLDCVENEKLPIFRRVSAKFSLGLSKKKNKSNSNM